MGRKKHHLESEEEEEVEKIKMTKKNKVHRKKSDTSVNEIEFKPVLDKHSCTDILCSLLFIIFIAILILVSVFAYTQGDPSSLINPRDSEGKVCDSNKPNLFYFDLTRCLSVVSLAVGCPTKQICVLQCPNVTSVSEVDRKRFSDPNNISNYPAFILKSEPLFKRCLPSILSSFKEELINQVINTDYNNETININATQKLTLGILFESTKYIMDIINVKNVAQIVYQDLVNSYLFILIALVAGAFIAFFWMILLRFLIKPMIYITILAVLAILGFCTYFCVNEYLYLNNNNSDSENNIQFSLSNLFNLDYLLKLKETWLAFSIISGVVFLILFLIVIFLRKRISMAAELIKETSKAITSIPSALFFPILPFLFEVGIIFYCGSTALYLASSDKPIFKIIDTNINNTLNTTNLNYKNGDICNPVLFNVTKLNATKLNDSSLENLFCTFYEIGLDENALNFLGLPSVTTAVLKFINDYGFVPQVFVLFMFFWLISFSLALNEMTLAGSFGAWYWTRFKVHI
jgi:solute carrier family 44 (choline transporter-like protein), member 2/4/5